VANSPVLIDPFACRMWACHDRMDDFLSEKTCRDIIESISSEGQKHPVLARPCNGDNKVKYELIYGARRWFAARHLNVELLACVRDIDNRAAFLEMDIENRLRNDISPYERGVSFKTWLRRGYFQSQEEIARTLGISAAHVCRLLKFAELPTAVIAAFRDPREIKTDWAVRLAERCADPTVRKQMAAQARWLRQENGMPLEPARVYRVLLDCNDKVRRSQLWRRDEIIRSNDGRALFRISYRRNDLHVILAKSLATTPVASRLTTAIRNVLETSESESFEEGERAPRQHLAFAS
jgi:ParB family transcriptional regulator, chromosome partitioning protein